MATDAQIQANRENAKKSTGPVTLEGKAASSQNNFRYGFRGAFRVYAGESQADFDALLNDLREEHQPATPTEIILVQRMAQHHWMAQRAQYLFNTHPEDLPFHKLIPELNLWMRYQTSNERAFLKCLTELRKLKAERRENEEIGFERQNEERAAKTDSRFERHDGTDPRPDGAGVKDEAAVSQRGEDSSDEAAVSQRGEDSSDEAAVSQQGEDSKAGFERQNPELIIEAQRRGRIRPTIVQSNDAVSHVATPQNRVISRALAPSGQ